MNRHFALSLVGFLSLLFLPAVRAQQGPGPMMLGPIPGIDTGLSPGGSGAKLHTDVVVPEAYVKGYRYEQVRILSEDGGGSLVIETSAGRVTCEISDLDARALQRFRQGPRPAEPGNGAPMPAPPTGKRISPNHDLLAGEELEMETEGEAASQTAAQTIEGTWVFSTGATLVFEGNPFLGEVITEEGVAVASYAGIAALSGVGASYRMTFPEGEEATSVTVDLKDGTYLVGNDEKGNRVRAYREGSVPHEGQTDYLPEGVMEKTPVDLARVDKDYLRLVRCVSHPWTSDEEQGPDCRWLPGEESLRRLGRFDGGVNPVTHSLVSTIYLRAKAVTHAYDEMEANLAKVAQLEINRKTTTTQVDAQGRIQGTTTTTEADTATAEYVLEEVRESWQAVINERVAKLDREYREAAIQLTALAPAMYETKVTLPRIVAVSVVGECLVVENVSGYPLSNLTVRVQVPAVGGDGPGESRLFYSPCLHMGQRRFSSAAWLGGKAETTPGSPQTTDGTGAPVKVVKVSAWAREAMQAEEAVAVTPPVPLVFGSVPEF